MAQKNIAGATVDVNEEEYLTDSSSSTIRSVFIKEAPQLLLFLLRVLNPDIFYRESGLRYFYVFDAMMRSDKQTVRSPVFF